jgi:hypothetical protein
MDGYGEMVESWVVDGWMSREQWWNDTDRGKLKYGEKNIRQRGG